MSKSIEHILFLSPAFPANKNETWIVTYFYNYIQALSKSYPDIKISIITAGYPKQKVDYKLDNVNVYSLGIAKYKVLKPFYWKKIIDLAVSINDLQKVSTLHALWLNECAFLAQFIGTKLNLNSIVTVMGSELISKNRYLRFIDVKRFLIVNVSEKMRTLFLQKHNINSHVITWGIEPKVLPFGILRNIDVLFVGYLNDNKSPLEFISIIKKMKKSSPNIKAIMIGEEYGNKKINLIIEENDLNDNIRFLGRLDNEDVKDYMLRSKVLVHTSKFESQGYVFVEALGAGMHIVSRDVGIAKSSRKWSIAIDENDFVKEIGIKLESELGFQSEVLFPICKTVDSYLNLYNSN